MLVARSVFVIALILLGGVASSTADESASRINEDQTRRQRIAELIEQLGDDRFAVRETAQAELVKFGIDAFDPLTLAEKNDDIEIAARARHLLGVILMDFDWVQEDDPADVKQVLAGFENLDAAGRLPRIRKLGERRGAAQIAALCRLVRFEKSPVLSKQAALAIMTGGKKLPVELAPTIQSGAGDSPRPGANWLRAYASASTKPDEAIAAWQKIVADEERVLEQTPDESRPEIVSALLRVQVDLLERLNRQDEALAAMERVIARETGETESLVELMRWMVQHQATKLLDALTTRFADRFNADPLLAYTLAEVRSSAGDEKQAKEIADRAFAMNPGDSGEHLEIARELNTRGQRKWAEREFLYVIDLGPPENINAIFAQSLLAEMYHDRFDDHLAGDLLKKSISTLEKAVQQAINNGGNASVRRILDQTLARMNFYYAGDAAVQKQTAQELEYLDKAAQADPTDADVLIALFRLSDPSVERKQKTEALIDGAIREFRAQIAQNPKDASGYNQLAWLLSNTERQTDEAVKLSLESLKLEPNKPGLLDTLGRCYYAAGDLENAIKAQSQAVELDPGSGLMRRQLELFQKKKAGG